MTRWPRWVGLLGLSVLVMAACARVRPVETGGPTPASLPPGDSQPTDWDHPFQGNGVQVASMEVASEDVSFNIVDPAGLGDANGIYVTPGPKERAAVAFMYDSPYGRVIVIEGLPDIPDAESRMAAYEDSVAHNGHPGYWTTSTIVTLASGDPAIVGASPYSSSTIEWVTNGVQFSVIGPELTSDQAVSIANGI